MIITDIKQGVKNPNRVNVFVDSSFAFSLDVAQVVEYKLKVGMQLSEDELVKLKRASEFGKLYQRALEWVLMRPRSEREVREYLWRKLHKASSDTASRQPVFTGGARLRSRQQPPKDSSEALVELSQTIIRQLTSKGYVDDRRFAEFWVENRFVKKGVSRRRLALELAKKGVAREIIDEVLDGRDDEIEIRKMIAKKSSKYSEPEKLMAYLVRQGFSYDLVRKMVLEED